MTIENLPNGDLFTKKPGAKKVFVKKGYCRTNRAYECVNWDDTSEFIYLKKGKEVFETNN